ncbi:MAG: hypothetical protein AAF539_09530 [Planctomycetota bacterium]
MLRDVIRSIDYSDCAEIALALFCVAFAMMTWATFRLSRRATDSFAAIPLDDQETHQ